MKTALKTAMVLLSRLLVLPAAFLAGFGRFPRAFSFWAQALSLIPGGPGSYLRIAYYSFTLDRVGTGCYMGMGSYFAHPDAALGNRVGIGSYCVIGKVDMEDGALLGSGIQILSGTRQHGRDEDGNISDRNRVFRRLRLGSECWIGAASVVLADVGAKSTVGAGSVVTRDVPDGVVVAGNPARLLQAG